MGIGRRQFIELSAGMFAAMALPACASVAVTRVRPSDGTVQLSPGDHPQLTGPDGHLRIQLEGAAAPLYVLALGDGEYAALSPICTHLGCTVNVEGEWLVCPCHGSTYDRTGQVLRGPAERPLLRLPLTSDANGDLIIQMEGE